MSVTLIAGLGSPGREYAGTHNLGFTVVEALAAEASSGNQNRFEPKPPLGCPPGVTRLLVDRPS
jgi:PTH1 family peptidyl-tRNA hydrolase